MEELSYSFHLGNDKNKTIKAKRQAINMQSGTTSKSNNAIQNIKHLGKVNHHNLRQYDNNQELIYTIKGSNNIINDVKNSYLDLFEESKNNYNEKQTRDDRKIDSYFNKISNDDKHDLACEIIIGLGNIEYWEDKTKEEKYKMINVFEKQINDLNDIVPNFFIANATIHFDEASPHLHIVGIPVKDNCKTGMSKQVGKTTIFTKESLITIQDKMRTKCIEEFNKEYSKDNKLKEKQNGQNKDYTAYERLKFNEKANQLKEELSTLREDVSDLEKDKNKINKVINDLNKDKEDINKEINKKKKINNKFIIKTKNQVYDDNKKLEKQIENLKYENMDYKRQYEELKEKNAYLLYHLNKIINKLPPFIKTIIDRLFIYKDISVKYFKEQYDPEVIRKRENKFNIRRLFNIKNNNEINKSLSKINDEMEETAEEFYSNDKNNDDYEL